MILTIQRHTRLEYKCNGEYWWYSTLHPLRNYLKGNYYANDSYTILPNYDDWLLSKDDRRPTLSLMQSGEWLLNTITRVWLTSSEAYHETKKMSHNAPRQCGAAVR